MWMVISMTNKMKKFLLISMASITLILFIGCQKEEEMMSETAYMLGTQLQISVWTDNKQTGSRAIEKSFERIAEIEKRLSVNIDQSDISLINKNAGVDSVDVHEDTAFVINKSLEYAKLSKGAFDPTIGKLVKLWGIGSENEKIPLKSEIEEALSFVDYNLLRSIDKNRFVLDKKGASIDLGGIAKGYAADEVYSILKNSGIKHAIINLGGNILTLGKKTDETNWRVGIQNPYEPTGTHMGIVEVVDQTVVTSGNYERFFIKDNIRYHHIIDTKTGYPADKGIISATIITNKSIDADALSTSVYTLGVEEGIKLIEGLQNVETIIITGDNKVYLTSGIEEKFTIVDGKFSLAD